MSHSLSHKVQFLFVVLLGSLSTSQVEWAQQTGVEGEGSLVQHHSEKEVKTCFLFWPGWLLARIFNREPWAQGISENSLTAARLLRSGLSLLWEQSPLERGKVSGECSTSSAKSWFSYSSKRAAKLTASASVLLLLFGEDCCNLVR